MFLANVFFLLQEAFYFFQEQAAELEASMSATVARICTLCVSNPTRAQEHNEACKFQEFMIHRVETLTEKLKVWVWMLFN